MSNNTEASGGGGFFRSSGVMRRLLLRQGQRRAAPDFPCFKKNQRRAVFAQQVPQANRPGRSLRASDRHHTEQIPRSAVPATSTTAACERRRSQAGSRSFPFPRRSDRGRRDRVSPSLSFLVSYSGPSPV